MSLEKEKKLLESEIESLNEEIKTLAYELSGLLNIGCSFGVCKYDPEIDDLQDKLQEVQEKKELLERIRKNIRSCMKKGS